MKFRLRVHAAVKAAFGLIVLAPICTGSLWAEERGTAVSGGILPGVVQGPAPQKMGLRDCIQAALQNNRRRTVSRFAVEITEAQRRQALSAYWPQMELRSTLTQRDDDLIDIFPAETSRYTITGLGPQPLQPIVLVPEKTVKLMGRTHSVTTFDLTYPLYTGGLRTAKSRQAEAGLEAAREEIRRTDLQVVYDIKRYYYGAVLARNITRIAQDALARLSATLDLTESLYTKGSGRVKKTDYLQNKVVVESIRSIVAQMEGREGLAKAALVNSMGMGWDASIEASEDEIPVLPNQADLKELVGRAYSSNPDWGQVQAGLKAAEAKVKEANSGHLPRIGLLGSLTYSADSYDKGIVGPQEDKTWLVGVGVRIPVFNGLLTQGQVGEARARLGRMEQEKQLLKDGLALQVTDIFLRMEAAQKQEEASRKAVGAAEENRELNIRAYQNDLVEVGDVIRAQLMEAFAKAQYQKVRYDHFEARAHLDEVIGEGLQNPPPGE